MNVLVTGANGQLGRSLRRVCANSGDNFIFTDVAELDICDAAAVDKMVADNDIDVIVNCAAYTNVDRAEDDAATAELLNGTAPGILAKAAAKHGALLVHVSTDYVFGGEMVNTPIREDAPVCPTGVYGVTKLHGEEAVRNSGCRHIIIRTAWLYSEYGRNFVKTMESLTGSRPEINVVYDQVGTPTYAGDLAKAIHHIITNCALDGKYGTYHFSNEGVCSWYDFAVAIARKYGHTGCHVHPCRSSEFPSKVVRPAYSVLDKSKIRDAFGVEVPYWQDSLMACGEFE